ncbi:MAG: lipoate--protein ligase family protein [Candidatus Omnitrophota bacterium]
MKIWRVIDTAGNTGRWNMEFDLKLLSELETENIPPTLRFYRWEPPAVSLGATQKPEEEINLDFCHKNGIDVVRRPSGGGAIFHQDEITYSFVARTSDHKTFNDLLTSYYTIIEGLKKGLEKIGVHAEIRGGKSCGPERYLPCFALSSRHDLVVGNKKIIGSAQRRKRKMFLQHGSIPFSYEPALISRIFLRPETFFEKATSLAEVLGHRPDENEVKKALTEGLAETMEINLLP